MEDEVIQINSKENKATFKQKLKGFFENIFSSWKKTTLYTGAVLLALCIIYFLVVLFVRDNFYNAESDDIYQYYPIMIDFIDSIKTGKMSMYNYTNYLGASFFSDTYYVPLDFFTLIIFLLSFIIPTEIAMSFVELLKLIAGTMALCWFLGLKGRKTKWIHLIGMLYFASSGITCFACFPSFTTLAFYLPFSLVIAEFFMRGKWYFVPPFATLCVFWNYYLAYTVFAFMAFSILSMLILDRQKWYKVIYKTAIYVALIVLGLFMGMVIFLPSVMFVLKSTTRNVIEEGSSLKKMLIMFESYLYLAYTFIKNAFTSFFSLMKEGIHLFKADNIKIRDSFVQFRYVLRTFKNTYYIDGKSYFPSFFDQEVLYRVMGSMYVPSLPSSFYGYLGSYFLEHASLYITGFGVLLSSYVWFLKDYRSKVFKWILIVIMVFMSVPFFSYIFSANLSVLYTRWMNVITIPLLLIASHVLEETDLKEMKLKYLLISLIFLLYFALYSATHHLINLTQIAQKNSWSPELIDLEEKAFKYCLIILLSIAVFLTACGFIRRAPKKWMKIVGFSLTGAALFTIVLVLGINALKLFNAAESNGTFNTEYAGSKPLYDVDALMGNMFMTLVTAMIITVAVYLIFFRKKKILIGLITLEFIISAIFSFASPIAYRGLRTQYKKTREVAKIVRNNTDTPDVYRVYVDSSISNLERTNLARFFDSGTNQNIFHSFINANTDPVVDLIFGVSDEGQAGKKKLNTYSYYLNVLLGYKYIVASVGSGFESYDESIFSLVYEDSNYIILEFKDYEPFLSYREHISVSNYNGLKTFLSESSRMSYMTKYGIINDEDLEEVKAYLGDESSDAIDYTSDEDKKRISHTVRIGYSSKETIGEKEYYKYSLDDFEITTRSYSINVYNLEAHADEIISSGGLFIEFSNGETYTFKNENNRSINGSTFHMPVYGASDKSADINGSSSNKIHTNDDGTQPTPKYIYIDKSLTTSSYLTLGFEAIFSSINDMDTYEGYGYASNLYAYFRYSAEEIAGIKEGLMMVSSSSSEFNIGSLIVEFEDGERLSEPTEFRLFGKEVKYIYIDKGSYSGGSKAPAIFATVGNSSDVYSDDLTNKELTVKGSKLLVSYDREITSDGYEIIMIPTSYSKEWKVVSGNVLDIVPINGGFLGLVVPTSLSHNDIMLKFNPYGFNKGLIISIISVLVYAVMVVLYINHKNKFINKMFTKIFRKKSEDKEVAHAKTNDNSSSL